MSIRARIGALFGDTDAGGRGGTGVPAGHAGARADADRPGEDIAVPLNRDEDVGVAARFDRGVAWNTTSKVSTRLAQFAVTVVLARLLAPADFGLYGMASMATMFIVMFAEFGFAHAIVQKPELTDADVATTMSLSVLSGAALTAVCFLGAGSIAALFREPVLTRPLQAASLGILVMSFGITPRALLMRRLDFRSVAVADFAGSAVYAATAVGLALAHVGVWSLILATLALSVCDTVVVTVRAKARPRFMLDRDSIRALLPFGSKVFGSNILDFLRGNMDYLVVGRALGPVALGVYTIAFKLADFPRTRLASIVGEVAFPAMSAVQAEREEVRRTYRRAVAMGSLIAFPVLLGLTMLAPEFVNAVYGPKWLGAVPVLRVLLPMGLLLCVAQPGISVLLAIGEPGRYLWLTALYAGAVGVLAAIGSSHGIVGVALGVLAATTLYFVGFQTIVWRRVRIGLSQTLRGAALPALGSAAMLAVLLVYRAQMPGYTVHGIHGALWLVSATLLGAAVYGAVTLPALKRGWGLERGPGSDEEPAGEPATASGG
jgi:O-antigen/teichoic acid export membrane protein